MMTLTNHFESFIEADMSFNMWQMKVFHTVVLTRQHANHLYRKFHFYCDDANNVY